MAATSAIGGLIGGPIGFVAAGVGGALLADAVFDKNEKKNRTLLLFQKKNLRNVPQAPMNQFLQMSLIIMHPIKMKK